MSTKSSKNKKIPSANLFPVVGIGASAGGLEAFKKLIKAIPVDSGMAFILVQHLHPDHTSVLPEILQRETVLPVEEVINQVKVKPNHIYIIPANKMLVANDGILELTPRPKDQKNMPIDIFFASLAEVHQNQAIGIVLSGTGSDGTMGLKKIKDYGGITFAQDTKSSAYDDMPQNAINAGVVDFVLSPEEMPKQLVTLKRALNQLDNTGDSIEKDLEENSFRKILTLIRVNNATDFTYYKQPTIRRRILRRIAIMKIEKVADYLEYLRQNKTERDILFQELLIPVTGFFRDSKTFEHLSENIFPELLKNKSSLNPIRIWIAGCSSGEEVYSIGICLHEYLNEKISSIKIQIFATDISEQSIIKARSGIYQKRQMQDVSDDRLQQFFTKIDGTYQIKKVIRDMCIFATHNFLKDPPFAKVDLISCRNVLIYMEPFLQKKAFTIFHYALIDKGFLLLGKSETTGQSSELFQSWGKDKFFMKKAVPGKFMNVTSTRSEEVLKDSNFGVQSTDRKKEDFRKSAENILLERYTPVGVIVNEQFDIVQFRGSTGAYLEPSPGKPTLNILKMAREGLSFELRNALHKTKASNETYKKEGIPLNNGKRSVTIEVIPLLDSIDLHNLILFTETKKDEGKIPDDKTLYPEIKEQEKLKILQLEKDISQAREDMRSITEEQEAANEELQSANEELLSGSEELQSLNEELETSKEELQSTNEELITVNQELFDRNEQLNQARIYAEGIITTIHEPLLVLNSDFRIKSANNAFYKTFSLTEKDTLGKIIFDLQDKGWDIPGLKDQLLILQQKKEVTLEWELKYKFPVVGERTICFNGQLLLEESGRQLILLALDDITAKKKAGQIQEAENLKLILESMPQIAFSTSANGSFIYFNKFFLEYSGFPLNKALDVGWFPILNPVQWEEVSKSWEHSIETLQNFNMEFQLRRKSDGMNRWHLCRATPIIGSHGLVTAWVGAATDIDDQKTIEKAKDDFISIASHELKTPLTSAKAFLQLIEYSMDKKKDPDLIFAKKANASLNTLHGLIAELLDVSKIQHGKIGLKISSFNFNSMLAEAIEVVQISSPAYKIILSGEIPGEIKGDPERLKQVIINLLSNAIKYTPGDGEVLVNASLEKEILMVSVKDSGIGIDKKYINKIFDRYYRGENQINQFQGLGIGLSISKEIINQHKGKIWAESELGRGSTFYFTLKISQ